MKRYLDTHIKADLESKMVFLAGPRQVGKTTLAQSLLPKTTGRYLNWDIPGDREQILRGEHPRESFIVLDELHKYRQWRNYLKGLYDASAKQRKILVTGSARLELYRSGGDSLQGRYFHHRLYPLSVRELGLKTLAEVKELIHLGGFPEPYFSSSEKFARRWSRDYRQRLIYDDVVSLEQTQELQKLELLSLRLPELVGSPLSVTALHEDLSVSPRILIKWVDVLERLYGLYRLAPFGSPKIQAVKKSQKHYHYDWSIVPDEGARFENFVAGHLLKHVHFLQDIEGETVDLRYYRDREQREVDFVIAGRTKPLLAIECKLSDPTPSPHLKYFKGKFPECRAVQLHLNGKKEFYTDEGIEVLNALTFLSELQA